MHVRFLFSDTLPFLLYLYFFSPSLYMGFNIRMTSPGPVRVSYLTDRPSFLYPSASVSYPRPVTDWLNLLHYPLVKLCHSYQFE